MRFFLIISINTILKHIVIEVMISINNSDIVISGLVIQDYEGCIIPENNSEEIVDESSDDSSVNN